ncbi:MAG: glycosyltransferase family 2 protein [Planctomycetota bacterium]|jgi:glycosyltransferase involved in cell wall biosynthesis
MAKVSVVLPVYNDPEYISYSIQSVLDQTMQDFELLVVDNCSTDNTVDCVKEFTDPRVRLVVNEVNMGHLYSINRGLALAEGEYLCVICSDDPEYGAVFTLARTINDRRDAFTKKRHFYYRIFDQENLGRLPTLRKLFSKGNFLCCPSVMMPARVYREIGPFRSHFQQLGDYDYWVRIALKYPLHILQEKLTVFRVRHNEMNMSGERPEVVIRIFPESVQIYKNFLGMEDLGDLKGVFPEISEEYSDLDERLIPFYLSMIALKSGNDYAKAFAIETLFELYDREGMADLIYEKHKFGYLNFIEVSGKYDTYNYRGCQTRIKSTTLLLGRLLKRLVKGRIFR